MADELEDVLKEIEEMKKAEESAGFMFYVQKIKNEFGLLLSTIQTLPEKMKPAESGLGFQIVQGFYVSDVGISFGSNAVIISNNSFEIKDSSGVKFQFGSAEIGGDENLLKKLADEIPKIGASFRKQKLTELKQKKEELESAMESFGD